jgi:hypothetical protein
MSKKENNPDICGYYHLRGSIKDWCPMDTKQRYEEHMLVKDKRKLLNDYGWDDKSITYKFNKFGFRCKDLTLKEQIMFIGCSYTMGMAVPEEYSFASIVAKELNLECYNLGLGGGTNDTAFRLAHYWVSKLNPKYLVFVEPTADRIELKSVDETWKRYNVRQHHGSPFYKQWFSNEANVRYQRERNIAALNYICLKNNTKFIHLDNKFSKVDKGRDLSHPGIESHKLKAVDVLNAIQSA